MVFKPIVRKSVGSKGGIVLQKREFRERIKIKETWTGLPLQFLVSVMLWSQLLQDSCKKHSLTPEQGILKFLFNEDSFVGENSHEMKEQRLVNAQRVSPEWGPQTWLDRSTDDEKRQLNW